MTKKNWMVLIIGDLIIFALCFGTGYGIQKIIGDMFGHPYVAIFSAYIIGGLIALLGIHVMNNINYDIAVKEQYKLYEQFKED